ncbi:unnamed protein product [Aphis gossypii]|uniref:Uncharacterized protein n=1 Tax=Aphis gossypii TaxID=80765 RepID=A0A9P0JF76_APHGO|nr:unnamed protein product [Aphis gossypii]
MVRIFFRYVLTINNSLLKNCEFIFFIFNLYTLYLICMYENLQLTLRTHSNNIRTNLNHKIKNKPYPYFIIFHIKIILYIPIDTIFCLWLYYYYYLCGNSYLGCFTVELYPTGPQVGQCFFPSIFFPAIDCPDDW